MQAANIRLGVKVPIQLLSILITVEPLVLESRTAFAGRRSSSESLMNASWAIG
jgi:L-cystine uptake protein TcyP (sodium:dicarboxylate symporter family)